MGVKNNFLRLLRRVARSLRVLVRVRYNQRPLLDNSERCKSLCGTLELGICETHELIGLYPCEVVDQGLNRVDEGLVC